MHPHFLEPLKGVFMGDHFLEMLFFFPYPIMEYCLLTQNPEPISFVVKGIKPS